MAKNNQIEGATADHPSNSALIIIQTVWISIVVHSLPWPHCLCQSTLSLTPIQIIRYVFLNKCVVSVPYWSINRPGKQETPAFLVDLTTQSAFKLQATFIHTHTHIQHVWVCTMLQAVCFFFYHTHSHNVSCPWTLQHVVRGKQELNHQTTAPPHDLQPFLVSTLSTILFFIKCLWK